MFGALTEWLFDPAGLTAHGFCLLWEPGLIWTDALADVGIGIAYFTIPLALAVFARRRSDAVFGPILWLFAAFILLCGATHWIGALTLFQPAYGLEAVVKAATALVSLATAVTLWRMMPLALAIPTPTQLRLANAALAESEARHRMGFENSPVPLHTLDGEGRLTGVSGSWLALLGYAGAEVIGRSIDDFRAPGTEGGAAQDAARLRSAGEIRDAERRFVRRDGSVVVTLLSARMERRGPGEVAVCALIDITARRAAEQALRATEERLHQSQKMEAVGQLTGGIAHDFNNMLQAIGGGLELMERRIGQGDNAGALRQGAAARSALDSAAALTYRLLAFSRRQAQQESVVAPNALVAGMEEMIRRTLGPAIQLDLRLQAEMWHTRCDPHQLESALLNLAINARDAMPERGTLTIATARWRLLAEDISEGEAASPGDFIELTVADTGAGMAPEVAARAFEPFFTTKPIGSGTGLGLSQLYGFVRQSGGVVRLDSQPGRGTRLRLYLPRRDPPPASAEAQDAQPASAGGIAGRRVLVVEDQEAVRAQVVEVLGELGCRVLEAGDGPAGLRAAEAGPALDLLVTDVGLPGMNGRQLAEAVRRGQPGLKVLFITGYAGMALGDLKLDAGTEILSKPFALDALARLVARMLGAAG